MTAFDSPAKQAVLALEPKAFSRKTHFQEWVVDSFPHSLTPFGKPTEEGAWEYALQCLRNRGATK